MAMTSGLDSNQTITNAADQAPLLQGRYILQEQLGRGHLAIVYRATDTVLDRTVAVKVLHPHICRDPAFVEQFLEMERRMARLFHPHLVTIFDAGCDGEQCYVVMEYVARGTLSRLLEVGSSLPTANVLKVVSQVAEALQLLHSHGIVHGEIKPDNILLDDEGNAKLVDFGIAHLATTTGVIRADSMARTAPYLAPEQLETGQADARSDIYALGLLTYELLAGRQPFDGDTWIAVATQRLDHDPHPLAQARPDLPTPLSAAVMRAIDRDPRRRFASADDFRAALDQVTVGRAAPTRSAAAVAQAPRRSPFPSRHLTPTPAPPWNELSVASHPMDRTEPGPRPGAQPRPTVTDRPLAAARSRLAGRSLSLGKLGALDPITKILLGAAALIALLMLGVALTLPRLFSGSSVGQTAITMPDLKGRPLEAARQDLAALGLAVGKLEERETADRPRGTVVEQRARPGAGLAPGSAVDLAVATPPRTAAPKLIDRQLGDAQADLEKAGLKLAGVQLQPVADKRAGTVLAQDPAPDTQLRHGDAITVTIAVPAPPP